MHPQDEILDDHFPFHPPLNNLPTLCLNLYFDVSNVIAGLCYGPSTIIKEHLLMVSEIERQIKSSQF